MKLSAELVNPFVEAGVKVIKELTDIEVRRGHLSSRVAPAPTFEVCIIIGVYGALTGQVVYSMKKELAVRLVKRMLAETPAQEFKALFLSTLGELANMITGNAAAILNKRVDCPLKITTPAVLAGRAINVNLVSNPTVVLGMYTPHGPLEISVALVATEEDDEERAGPSGSASRAKPLRK